MTVIKSQLIEQGSVVQSEELQPADFTELFANTIKTMRLLHFTPNNGELHKEYVVLIDADQDTQSFRQTFTESGFTLVGVFDVCPGEGHLDCLPTESRLGHID